MHVDTRRCLQLSADACERGSLAVRCWIEILRDDASLVLQIAADARECGSLIVTHWIVISCGCYT